MGMTSADARSIESVLFARLQDTVDKVKRVHLIKEAATEVGELIDKCECDDGVYPQCNDCSYAHVILGEMYTKLDKEQAIG